MNNMQNKLMKNLRDWTIADRNNYVTGYGTREACILWENVVGATYKCSHEELVEVWIYAAQNQETAGFGKHDVTTASRQANFQLKIHQEVVEAGKLKS